MTVKSKISGGTNETASGYSFKLSDNVLIQCPLKGFALRKALMCFKCDNYGGIVPAISNGKPISGESMNDFRLICKQPTPRQLIETCKE